MKEKKIYFGLPEELCAFLKHTSINFPGNDALLQQMTQRMLSPMQEADCEKMKRFLILFKSIRNKQKPEIAKIIRYDRRLVKAKDFIERNFDKELTLPRTADHVGLAKETLSRLFRRQLSTTCSNYVNNFRINKAIRLLLETDYNINEIAYQCGFNSNHYFNRTFRKIKGMTPGMFRRRGYSK